MKSRRAIWRMRRGQWPVSRLVFMDETFVSTTLTRPYGGCPRGQRLTGTAPHGRWKTTTCLAALRVEGFTAPFVLEGPLDGAWFKAYVEQQLAPTLRPSDCVILDNLSSHKLAGIREIVEARGAQVMYLSPYSPDFNPIELAFAKLKAPRNVLWRRSGLGSANCSTSSRPLNAEIMSTIVATALRPDEKGL